MKRGWFRFVLRTVLLLLVIAAGGWLGQKISTEPGYVLVVFNNWSIETSVWIGALLIVTAFAVLYALLWLFRQRSVALKLKNWNSERKSRQSIKRLREGLFALARGQFRKAHRHFLTSANHAELPYLNFLLASLAAHFEGREDEADQCLSQAEKMSTADPVMTGLLQAMVQVQRNDNEQALATLNRMQGEEQNPFRLELLRKVYLALEDWKQLETVLKKQEKSNTLNKNAAMSQKLLATQRLTSEPVGQLGGIWKNLPATLKHDKDLILLYVQRLEQANMNDEAEQFLHRSLNARFSDVLIDRYGQLSADPQKQLISIERWLKERPNDVALLLAAGRLSLANEFWGKAQDYLELSIRIRPTAEAHAELARFYRARNDLVKSQEHYQQGLDMLCPLKVLPLPNPADTVAAKININTGTKIN